MSTPLQRGLPPAKLKDQRYRQVEHTAQRIEGSPTNAAKTIRDYTAFAIKHLAQLPHRNTKIPVIDRYYDKTFVERLAKYLFYTPPQEIFDEVGYQLVRQFAEIINYGDFYTSTTARTHPLTTYRRLKEYTAQLKTLATLELQHQLALAKTR